MDRLKVFSIPVSIGSYKQFVETIVNDAKEKKNYYTCVANVHMLIEAFEDKNFAKTVSDAKIVTPDGRPLTWAIRMLYGIQQDRVAGMDLLPDLLGVAEKSDISVYFYGGHPDMISKTDVFLKARYPGLRVAGLHSPPFRKLTSQEESDVVTNINNSGAQIVFVALGCPKQEKWMAEWSSRINGIMIGIGGALPVMVGAQKRAPNWIQKYGLEWLYRLVQEPRRLFKRYAITNSKFIYLFAKSYISSRFRKKNKPGTDAKGEMMSVHLRQLKNP